MTISARIFWNFPVLYPYTHASPLIFSNLYILLYQKIITGPALLLFQKTFHAQLSEMTPHSEKVQTAPVFPLRFRKYQGVFY